MTKTFKIGEYAIGGIIKVTVRNFDVKIQALDWNTKQVVEERDFHNVPFDDIEFYLEDQVTSSYYAGKIMEFIKA
jgi:hypothetical protein